MARGNGAAWRWALVLGLVAVLAALPALIGALPAADSTRSAADLRTAALASSAVGYSGYAQSAGGLALPQTDQLGSVADLFSDRTTMRVWWRSAADNRVDVLAVGGETDFYQDSSGSWTWDYEANRVTRSEAATLALPAPSDLLPPTLARRLLSEARPGELSRLPADRVAGRDALGLRLVPADAASSVARVNIWVDADSGLPLRVQVFGRTGDIAALDSHFLDLELGPPDASVTSFSPPAGARQQRADPLGVLQAGGRLSPIALPATLAGLPRRTLDGAPPTIGLYGRGITLLAVLPLPARVTAELERAAAQNPTAVRDDLGTRMAIGPVGILLVDPPGRTSYGLIGTVTVQALEQAARELPGLEGPP